jgi:hypothetical protein
MVSWENISNIQPQGGPVSWEWFSPQGVSFVNASTTIPSSSGGYLWQVVYGTLYIRNHPASSMPGTWQVIVYYNGVKIATQSFTIQSAQLPPPLTLGSASLAMGVNTTINAPINVTTSFSSTSLAVYSWLNFTNVPRPSHNVTWTFIMPNGTLYENQVTYMTTDPGASGPWSYWTAYSYASINGYPAASVTGTWKIDIYIDGRPSLVQSFTIT